MAVCNPLCSLFWSMISLMGVIGLFLIKTALQFRYRYIGEWFDEGDESLQACKSRDDPDQCVSALQAKASDVAGDISKAIAIFAAILAASVFSIVSHRRAGRI